MTPSIDTLWAYATGELPAAEAAAVKAQLDASAEARAQLAEVEASLRVLSLVPQAPPMPDALARRVGAALAEHVDEAASRSFSSWWRALFSGRALVLAGAAAAVAVGLVWFGSPTPVEPTVAVVPERPVAPLERLPLAPKPVKAVVASVRKASSSKGALSAAQVLETGASVSTEAGGSLWLKLPDGTKTGLTGATDVKLAKLDQHEVTLDVAKGSVALVVPHREDRLLTVRAGDVEVKDLGTRFLVSREVTKVVVAVEEGSVEVRTPTSTRVVMAGHAVAWHDGALDDYDWKNTQPPAPPAPPTAPAVKVAPAPALAAPAVAERDDEPQTEDLEPESPDPDSEWATPPAEAFAQRPDAPVGLTPPAPPAIEPLVDAPPPSVVTVQPGPSAPVRRRRNTGFNLRAIQENLQELQRQASLPFGSNREAQARAVRRFADQGDCLVALQEADRWLMAPAGDAVEEAPLRRMVLQQKVRCLNHLGRTSEALEVQRQLGP